MAGTAPVRDCSTDRSPVTAAGLRSRYADLLIGLRGDAKPGLVISAPEDDTLPAWIARALGFRRGSGRSRFGMEVLMTKMAVAVMPIADMGAWQTFMDEISTGSRGEAHRAFLRRGGVSSESVFHQPTPMGDLMVLVWDGVDSDELAAHFGSMLQSPTSDHERYLRDFVIPKLHGIDTAQPPPAPARQVAEITT